VQAGGVVIAAEGSLRKLPDEVRRRLAPVAQWEHIPGYLPETTVLRSWRTGDPRPLFEPVLALELATPGRREGEVVAEPPFRPR
jgi:hypothetical protein